MSEVLEQCLACLDAEFLLRGLDCQIGRGRHLGETVHCDLVIILPFGQLPAEREALSHRSAEGLVSPTASLYAELLRRGMTCEQQVQRLSVAARLAASSRLSVAMESGT